MLNISKNSVETKIDTQQFSAFKEVYHPWLSRALAGWLVGFLFIVIVMMFLPWTQNIQVDGRVTSLRPEHRAQTIHATIPGRIEKWYVGEGDYVHRGDTILFLSEVKDDYFDPDLLERTQDQVKAKEMSFQSYEEKVRALEAQIQALEQVRWLKLEQARNKVEQTELKLQADSVAYEMELRNYDIADQQFQRQEKLYDQGLKSLTELEARKLKFQEAQNKLTETRNKLLSTKNDLLNAKIELNSIENDYNDKISKARSERMSALSSQFSASADLAKLKNQYTNYQQRAGFYYIIAPQEGYITKVIKTGLGETVKEGEAVVTFIPGDLELAVELYVEPIDLPLVDLGNEVRLQFDGWPVLVFNGWPNIYYGTFDGKVAAIDNITSENGKYRILVAPDSAKNHHPWPKQLRMGSGARGIALLNEVPVWYELWRQLNSFPPDMYGNQNPDPNKAKGKKK